MQARGLQRPKREPPPRKPPADRLPATPRQGPPLASDTQIKLEDQSKAAAAACWPLAVSDTQYMLQA